MAAVLVGSNTFGFADGNTGHLCALGTAPNVGELDVLCVNSDTVVSTPAGFTVGESAVGGQGSYLFYRIATGGESSTVTVTTSGNFNAQVSWSRWSGVAALDQHANARVDAVGGVSTPAVTTPVLAGTNELVIAFAALHSFPAAAPSGQVWSGGYTGLTSVTQGAAANGVTGYVAYRTDAGTAAESPNVGWSNTANDRYILAATFTTALAAATPAPAPVVVSFALWRSTSW